MIIIKRKVYSSVVNNRTAGPAQPTNISESRFKKLAKKVGNYAKKNPDEFAVLGASYGIPFALGARYAKTGNLKKVALVSSIAAFPIGEGYIAAKKGIQAISRRKKEKNSETKSNA